MTIIQIKSIQILLMSPTLVKWSFTSIILIFFIPFAQDASCQPPGNPFEFYSSQTHSSIKIDNVTAWERQRYSIKDALQQVMGPLPLHLPTVSETIYQDTFETSSYTRYNLILKGNDDVLVTAYLYIPKRLGLLGDTPAMVALHPTGDLGKRIVDGEGLPNRGYARELAERGYIVIAPDYPGYGDLQDYDFENSPYASGTMAGIANHCLCISFLQSLSQVDGDRIGAIGHSLGGHNAMFLAALDHRIKVAVASCGWTQFEYYDIGPAAIDRYGGRLGPWAQDRYMPRLRSIYHLNGDSIPFNFHEIISLIAPRPFFSNSPVNDANFDVKGVTVGLDLAGKVYHYLNHDDELQVRYPDAEHDFPTDTRKQAYEFIDKHLSHHPSPHHIE